MYKPEDDCLAIFAHKALDVVDNIAMAMIGMRCDAASSLSLLSGFTQLFVRLAKCMVAWAER